MTLADKIQILQNAIHFYDTMLNTRYKIVLASKSENRIVIDLCFEKTNWSHLIGLGKLSGVEGLKANGERIYKDIESGKIRYEVIAQAHGWNKIEERVQFLPHLQDIIEKCTEKNGVSHLYKYIQPNNSDIKADYVWIAKSNDDRKFCFYIKYDAQREKYYGVSFFKSNPNQTITTAKTPLTIYAAEKLQFIKKLK